MHRLGKSPLVIGHCPASHTHYGSRPMKWFYEPIVQCFTETAGALSQSFPPKNPWLLCSQTATHQPLGGNRIYRNIENNRVELSQIRQRPIEMKPCGAQCEP